MSSLNVWNASSTSRRDYVRRVWPELAHALDTESVARDFLPTMKREAEKFATRSLMAEFARQDEEAMAARPIARRKADRCPASGCVLVDDHPFPYDHLDEHGSAFRNEPCDGCKRIKRMEEMLPPNDEDAAYHFQRAARHHRKECPNR